jgi:hypothetical protein
MLVFKLEKILTDFKKDKCKCAVRSTRDKILCFIKEAYECGRFNGKKERTYESKQSH